MAALRFILYCVAVWQHLHSGWRTFVDLQSGPLATMRRYERHKIWSHEPITHHAHISPLSRGQQNGMPAIHQCS
jgi:hypothetical protein